MYILNIDQYTCKLLKGNCSYLESLLLKKLMIGIILYINYLLILAINKLIR